MNKQLNLIITLLITFLFLNCSSDDSNGIDILGGWGAISIDGITTDDITDCRKNNNIFFNNSGSGLYTRPEGDTDGNYMFPCLPVLEFFTYELESENLTIFDSDENQYEWNIVIDGEYMTVEIPNLYTIVYQKGVNFED